jgi:hypothetical protein
MRSIHTVFWCLAAGAILTLLVGILASVAPRTGVGMLLAPGMFIAAIIFTDGVHSNHPMAYLVLAGIMDALVLAAAVYWLSSKIQRRRHRS